MMERSAEIGGTSTRRPTRCVIWVMLQPNLDRAPRREISKPGQLGYNDSQRKSVRARFVASQQTNMEKHTVGIG